MHYSFDTYKKEHLRVTWLLGRYTDEQLKEKYYEQYTELCNYCGLEHGYMVQLFAQIHAYEISIEHLKQMCKVEEVEDLNYYIDKWLNQKFGIKSQKDARNSMYIVFDSRTSYIRTVTCNKEFYYISPDDNEDLLEFDEYVKLTKTQW